MDRYDYHRIVSWIAFHVNQGETWKEIQAINSRRRAPFTAAELRSCRKAGEQAVKNSHLIAHYMDLMYVLEGMAAVVGLPKPTFPPLRLCDIAGCKWPKVLS